MATALPRARSGCLSSRIWTRWPQRKMGGRMTDDLPPLITLPCGLRLLARPQPLTRGQEAALRTIADGAWHAKPPAKPSTPRSRAQNMISAGYAEERGRGWRQEWRITDLGRITLAWQEEQSQRSRKT